MKALLFTACLALSLAACKTDGVDYDADDVQLTRPSDPCRNDTFNGKDYCGENFADRTFDRINEDASRGE